MSEEHDDLFDQLYRDNQAKVYRLAVALSGNAHDAEDITQEAFFRAFRSYDSFREDSSFFTWIYRITVNVSNDYLKHRAKTPLNSLTEDQGYSLEEIIDPNPANNPETELLAYQVRIKCLHAMTECLPADQRKVFCLAITMGLPHKLIAEILECSVSSVKTTLHRAKKRWYGFMEGKCQLIRKTNTCNCKQYVRFGLSKGWFSKGASVKLRPPVTRARDEVLELQALQDFYRDLYPHRSDETFAQRVRDGIRNKEWSLFS